MQGLVRFLTRQAKTPEEKYLEAAADPADLENRMRSLHR